MGDSEKGWAEKFWVDGVVLGDFSEEESWWKVTGQVLIGLVPYAGQVADIRDIAANIKGVAEGKNLIPEDYDINRYNSSSVGKREAVTVQDARASLAQSHANLLEWVSQLDDSVLDKEGRHAILQTMTVEKMLEVMAQHESGHTRDIEAMIAQNA